MISRWPPAARTISRSGYARTCPGSRSGRPRKAASESDAQSRVEPVRGDVPEEVVLVVLLIHVAVAELGGERLGELPVRAGDRLIGDLRAHSEPADVAVAHERPVLGKRDQHPGADHRVPPVRAAG